MKIIKRIRVILDRQVLQALEDVKVVMEFDCATGDSAHPTEPGHFKIFRKHRKYRSKKYDAQMDFAMFFTQDGKAIHKSNFVGTVSMLKYLGFDSIGSHGCVRLAGDNAETLFNWAPMGTTVDVVEK